MAKHVLKDGVLFVNGVDLSDHVQAMSVEVTRPEIDVTAMGNDYMDILPGIADATVTVTFFQDYAAAKVYATLQPLALSDTPFPIRMRASSAAISATNPEVQMNVLMYGFSPIGGDVGSANTLEVSFRNADQAGIVYDIVP
jgi:hypothetical protein